MTIALRKGLKRLLKTTFVLERVDGFDAFGNRRFAAPESEEGPGKPYVLAVINKTKRIGDNSVRVRDITGEPVDFDYTIITDMYNIQPGDRLIFEDRITYAISVETFNNLRGIPEAQQVTLQEETTG